MGSCGKVELLAPAGSAESFYGAVHAGADAVYLAGSRFGARAYAENFTDESLLECIRYGHLLGRKIYLAVNTLLKDSEMSELYDYIAPFCEAGLDAVIVQDPGVFAFLREHFPGLRLHVSTQMTLCSGWGASLLKKMGAERIIPARELSLQELISMKEHSGMEIETFVHGAMCYCYSGQCLFSSIAGGRSGNRGRCAQPCRLPYSVSTPRGKSGVCYPLSLKDMCTIEKLPRLIQAGIDSFKIEGRMKKPEYAAGVTEIYRRYIDIYYELRERLGPGEAAASYRVAEEDRALLSSLYVRSGLQDGYYFRYNGRSMITLDSPAYGKSDERLLERLREKYIRVPLKLPITVRASFRPGQKADLSLECGEIRVEVTGNPVEQARKTPVTEENIRKQLCRLGDTPFYVEKTEINAGEDCFYPLKEINGLRREAVALLEEKILLDKGYGKKRISVRPEENGINSGGKISSHARKGYAVLTNTAEQLRAVTGWLAEGAPGVPFRIYIEGDLLLREPDLIPALCRPFSGVCSFYIALPYILRQEERTYLDRLFAKASGDALFGGFLVRSMDGLGYLAEKGNTLPCRTDAGLYVWNRYALRELEELAEGFCLPYELKAAEQLSLLGGLPCEKIVYSRIPMMVTANCVLRTMGQCRKSGRPSSLPKEKGAEAVTLTDRHHREFPVAVNCTHCLNIIYNALPFSLYRERDKWREKADLRLDFTMESAREVRHILDAFFRGAPLEAGEYTTGHEKRGVE